MTLIQAAAALWAIVNVLDAYSTVKALSRPGVVEANPVIRFFMKLLPGHGWIAAKLLIAAGLGYYCFTTNDFVTLFGVSAVYGLVIANNFRLAAKK